jgi:hypothetical protein
LAGTRPAAAAAAPRPPPAPARAGKHRFELLSTPRAHANPPYETDLWYKKREGRVIAPGGGAGRTALPAGNASLMPYWGRVFSPKGRSATFSATIQPPCSLLKMGPPLRSRPITSDASGRGDTSRGRSARGGQRWVTSTRPHANAIGSGQESYGIARPRGAERPR